MIKNTLKTKNGSIDLDKIYNIDCLRLMEQMEDNSVDLIITDPPYGINIGTKVGVSGSVKVGGGKICKVNEYIGFDDTKIPSKQVFKEMIRVSKNQIIFGGNYFIEYLYNSPCWIVWDKDNTGNFADCELAWTSFKSAVRKFIHRWNGMLQEDMKWKEKRYHPTQKPVPLGRWLLNTYAKKGDIIFDPFCGSGSFIVASHQLRYRYIGCDISAEYCGIANKRLQQENLKQYFQ